MQEIKWGMIGCGSVTEKKAGAPAINAVPHAALVAVMARNAEKAADYAKRHQVPRWYTDADALINDPEVNAVYIATPPNVHLYYARKVIMAGKAVYIEKPMALNYGECAEINRLAGEAGVPVYVAYYRRTLPYFLQLKKLVEERVVGDIRLVTIHQHFQPYDEEVGDTPQPRWRVFPDISGGGHFHDLAAHQFDLLAYIFGDIQSAKGFARNQAGLYPAADAVVASFEFENGVLGSGSWCYTVNKEQRIDHCEFIGASGKIVFSFFEPRPIQVYDAAGVREYHIPHPPHVHQPLLETIVKELRGEAICPSTGETGARSSLVMDWITKERE